MVKIKAISGSARNMTFKQFLKYWGPAGGPGTRCELQCNSLEFWGVKRQMLRIHIGPLMALKLHNCLKQTKIKTLIKIGGVTQVLFTIFLETKYCSKYLILDWDHLGIATVN